MREGFGQAALDFSTAPFLQGPNHQSMRGLLLAFASTHPCTAFFIFVVNHGISILRLKDAFAALPKTYACISRGALLSY